MRSKRISQKRSKHSTVSTTSTIRRRSKPCARCGKDFQPTSNRSKFCSLKCKRGSGNCEHCGKEFVRGRKDGGRQRFCSMACYNDATTPLGSIHTVAQGYNIIKVLPDTPGIKVMYGPNRNGWMYEHRYVMQQKLKRPLLKTEHVHHINGIKTDNRAENLELWKGAHPRGVRDKDYHCPGCRCFEKRLA